MSEVNESSIFEMDPTEIILREDAPRYRRDLGDIEDMVNSIQRFGQLQPIVISRDNELIYGGRRLTACILGGFKAKVCYKDTIDPFLMRELELEENLQRKALTPSEASLAIEALHELKQSIYGESTSGREGGWSLEKTAELLGKTAGFVSQNLQIASMIHEFPNLAGAGSKDEIKKTYRGLARIQQTMEALTSYEETVKDIKEFKLTNDDALVWMKSIADNSVDLLFTDPPYGISVHENAITIGGQTGGDFTTSGIKYDDSEENAKTLLTQLAIESYRFTKGSGQAYIFCAPSIFWWLRDTMGAAGWLVRERPIIWIKRETGQNNQPAYWPSAAYEFILFARKPEANLVLQGRPDWVQCDIVLSSLRIHQAEKPIVLCKELIARTCMPGDSMIDPFAGSGALMEAACEMKVFVQGCELGVEAYASAMKRLTEWKRRQRND